MNEFYHDSKSAAHGRGCTVRLRHEQLTYFLWPRMPVVFGCLLLHVMRGIHLHGPHPHVDLVSVKAPPSVRRLRHAFVSRVGAGVACSPLRPLSRLPTDATSSTFSWSQNGCHTSSHTGTYTTNYQYYKLEHVYQSDVILQAASGGNTCSALVRT